MADEEGTEGGENASNEEGGGGGKKKIILLAVMGLVIVGLSVGGTIAAIKMLGGDEPVPAEGEEEMPVEEVIKPAIYYPLKPSILVHYDTRGRQRYLQADMTLMTRDDDVIAAIETHMPMIRNALVMIIGGQIYEEVQTAEGKELMRLECLQELQRLLELEIGKPGVEQVLFTNLVMQ